MSEVYESSLIGAASSLIIQYLSEQTDFTRFELTIAKQRQAEWLFTARLDGWGYSMLVKPSSFIRIAAEHGELTEASIFYGARQLSECFIIKMSIQYNCLDRRGRYLKTLPDHEELVGKYQHL